MNYQPFLLQTFRATLMLAFLVGCGSPAPELPISTPDPTYTPAPSTLCPTYTPAPATPDPTYTPVPATPLPTPDLTTRPQIWFRRLWIHPHQMPADLFLALNSLTFSMTMLLGRMRQIGPMYLNYMAVGWHG